MEKVCWLCGANGATDRLERHHVYRGKNRALSESYGAVVWLCGNECHRNGRNAVHRNPYTRLRLERHFQKKIMEEYNMDTEDFIFVFGRNYL